MLEPIKITLEISDEILLNLLCSAFEGGSNYWYTDVAEHTDPTHADDENCHHWAEWNPVYGGSIVVTDEEGEKHLIDRAALQRGMQIMVQNYPQHFDNVITGDDDAETGDVFLQCCCFGEIVYG